MTAVGACRPDVVLFGAHDRHNLGDLLFAHVAARRLGDRPLRIAGLAARDLREPGGHRVEAIGRLLAHAARTADRLHVGGEILTCTAWQAAVMLAAPDEAAALVGHLERDPEAQRRWVRQQLGGVGRLPYVAPPWPARHRGRVIYHAVGGVALDRLAPAELAELQRHLVAAAQVTVRDRRTQALLARLGIDAGLVPDPVALIATDHAGRLAAHAGQGPVAEAARRWPQGYLAFQCGPEFADDRTLALLGESLVTAATTHRLGIVLFRAGTAPWHDDPSALARLAGRLGTSRAGVFPSVHVWDVAALIAGARVWAGSSLHGRIVAMACARPRVGLRGPGRGGSDANAETNGNADTDGPDKQACYAETWDDPAGPGCVLPEDLAPALDQALRHAREARLARIAARLAARAARAFEAAVAVLEERPAALRQPRPSTLRHADTL